MRKGKKGENLMDKKKLDKLEQISKEVEMEEARLDIIDVLLDEENKDPIVLVDDKGRKLSFEQVAVIPYNEKLYCVLKPLDKIEGVQVSESGLGVLAHQ